MNPGVRSNKLKLPPWRGLAQWWTWASGSSHPSVGYETVTPKPRGQKTAVPGELKEGKLSHYCLLNLYLTIAQATLKIQFLPTSASRVLGL